MSDSPFYDSAGPFSLGELLSGLNVEPLISSALLDEIIHRPSDLRDAISGTITFLANAKHKTDLTGSKATACFTTEKLASDVSEQSIIPLISSTPRAHFARVVSRLIHQKSVGYAGKASIGAEAKVHPTAIIGEGAVIGSGALVGPFCVIGPGVKIGANCHLESHVVIQCAELGAFCIIKSGAQIGGEGFGMDGDESGIVALPHIGRAILGDRVRVGAHTCIDRGFLGDTVIGDDVKIDNQVQIAHNCKIGSGSMIAAHTGISGSCHVGKNVLMGGAVGLADHINVGDGAQIAASAGVMHNIPAGEIWSGTPAQPIRDHMRMISATRKLIKKKKV